MMSIRNFSFFALEQGMRFYSPAAPTVFATIVYVDLVGQRVYYRWDGQDWTNYFYDNDIGCVLVEGPDGKPLIDRSPIGMVDDILNTGRKKVRRPSTKKELPLANGIRGFFDKTFEFFSFQFNR